MRALVTGASRGIGRAIAQELAAQGWQIAVHYGSNASEAERTGALLGKQFSGAYRADLNDPTSVAGLWKAVVDSGPVDALVNNAGVYTPASFLTCTDEQFERDFSLMFRVNFESPLRLMRLACRTFSEAGEGKILNVASRVGFRGEAGAALYAASKAALINLTRSLAVELAPNNIGVFGIAPSWVDTAMGRDGMAERLPAILATLPLGRMATPEDCAAVSAFLLSPKGAYLSGQVIDINGASYFH